MNYILNPDQVRVLSDIACDKIEFVLDELGIDYRKGGKFYSGPCPIHQGDNYSAWNLYPEGYDIRGIWKCRTHLCHKTHGSTLLGLIQGIKGCSQSVATKWLCDLLNINLFDIKVNQEIKDKLSFIKDVKRLEIPKPKGTISREEIRNSIKIPATYYVQRGYSKEILDRYDVGLCDKPQKPFYNRIVVPVYTSEFKYLGAVARTILPKCNKCGFWHNNECPIDKLSQYKASKWVNSTGFRADSILYNLNYALPEINKTGVVILVEGAGDVWRLEEAGIHNGLAILGNEISPIQSSLLQTTGALKIIPLLDEDKGGSEGKSLLKKSLGRIYEFIDVSLPQKDVGEISVGEIQDILIPVINRIKL